MKMNIASLNEQMSEIRNTITTLQQKLSILNLPSLYSPFVLPSPAHTPLMPYNFSYTSSHQSPYSLFQKQTF